MATLGSDHTLTATVLPVDSGLPVEGSRLITNSTMAQIQQARDMAALVWAKLMLPLVRD